MRKPSFFKVLIRGYTRRLKLPRAFVQKYGGFLPQKAKLRTSWGETWDVKLEEDDEKYLCFTRGWGEFVKDLELQLGEFLEFCFNVGESTFDVAVFGTNWCEREISTMNVRYDLADEDDESNNEYCFNVPDVVKKRGSNGGNNGGTSKLNPLYFEIVLKLHQRSRLTMPKKFWTAAGLKGKKSVELVYASKNSYGGCVVVEGGPESQKLEIGRGWNAFRKTNGLVYGKKYSFEFQPANNVIKVKEVENN